jgi:DNA-binding transcriptional ArsR family regulator
MITWRFTPDDVARVRFAFSPLNELVLSLIVLRAPGRHSLHLPWVRATRPRLSELDLTELFALVPVRGDTADFLTPPPTTPVPDFAAELESIRQTAPDRLITDLGEVHHLATPIADRIRTDPDNALNRIADALQAYWNIALADHWPRIHSLLDADVLWRSRRLALGGARALFEDLHPTITWYGDSLSVTDAHDHSGSLSGEGLLLTPCTMAWPTVRKMIEPYQPTITYPPRGIATLWETGTAPTPAALAALVGRTRASMLAALAEPISTTSLAHRLLITPGAVSQHLSVLLDCGLATRSRVGRFVLYRRTRSGDALATTRRP